MLISLPGGVVRAGSELNNPAAGMLAPPHKGSAGPQASWFSVSGDNVMIETVKKAEDDDGVIVRLYEANGCRGRRTLRTSLPLTRAVETDLMEREERELAMRNA